MQSNFSLSCIYLQLTFLDCETPVKKTQEMAEEGADLRVRAQHLFAICDKEEKGFVTRRDMQV
jgi:hypothetical protein